MITLRTAVLSASTSTEDCVNIKSDDIKAEIFSIDKFLQRACTFNMYRHNDLPSFSYSFLKTKLRDFDRFEFSIVKRYLIR